MTWWKNGSQKFVPKDSWLNIIMRPWRNFTFDHRLFPSAVILSWQTMTDISSFLRSVFRLRTVKFLFSFLSQFVKRNTAFRLASHVRPARINANYYGFNLFSTRSEWRNLYNTYIERSTVQNYSTAFSWTLESN